MTDTLDLYDLFHTSNSLEEDGVWVDLNGTTKFKVRAIGAKAVTDLNEKLRKPFLNLTRVGMDIPDEKSKDIALRVLSEAVLVDWVGVKLPLTVEDTEVAAIMSSIPANKIVANDDGTHKFNSDVAYALCKALPKLGAVVMGNAMEMSNFRDQQTKESLGN